MRGQNIKSLRNTRIDAHKKIKGADVIVSR
jgi:hypothetical protein